MDEERGELITWVIGGIALVIFSIFVFSAAIEGKNEEKTDGQRYVLVWMEGEEEREMEFSPSSIDTFSLKWGQRYQCDDDTTISVAQGVCCVESHLSDGSKSVMVVTDFVIRPVDDESQSAETE